MYIDKVKTPQENVSYNQNVNNTWPTTKNIEEFMPNWHASVALKFQIRLEGPHSIMDYIAEICNLAVYFLLFL